MTACALIQARMSSSRLPGKVLKPLAGVPMLQRMVERTSRATLLDKVVVLTSSEDSDDAIAEFCQANKIACKRGKLNDVMGRYLDAVKSFPEINTFVRLTADCPLIDAQVIDDIIQYFNDGEFDYASNCIDYTLPDGLDAEVFSREAFLRSARQANKVSEREHVTLHIRNHPELFNIGIWRYQTPFTGRWTVDHEDDFQLVEKIYQHFLPQQQYFDLIAIKQYLEAHPEIESINLGHIQNEGMIKSMTEDRTVEVDEYGQVPELN